MFPPLLTKKKKNAAVIYGLDLVYMAKERCSKSWHVEEIEVKWVQLHNSMTV